MADLSLGSKQTKKTAYHSYSNRSTRVDLTPMVDLGFLLITFFIFTTTLSKPRSLHLIVPAEGNGTFTAAHKTLNLILTGDNMVRYYIGNEVGNQGCADFSPAGVRSIIRSMQQQVHSRFGNNDETVVLIRPTAQSSYMNLIDILDELLIAGIKKYALMDEPDERLILPANLRQPC